MSSGVCASFATNGDMLAVASADGRVRVWDAKSGDVRHDFLPEDLAGAAVTCLEWRAEAAAGELGSDGMLMSRRKRSRAHTKYDRVIAGGTLSGNIVVLNVDQGTSDCTLNAHKSAVNCLAMCSQRLLLYSGSDDRYIIEWNTDTWQEQQRWKGDKHCVTALCCAPDNSLLLLSAGRTIKLWNTATREAVKTFSGHSNLVRQLQFVPAESLSHFVSRAENERAINAWSIASSSKMDRKAVATFSATAELNHMHVNKHPKKQDMVCLVALSREDCLHIFSERLDGCLEKPIASNCTIQIASSSERAKSVVSSVPFLSAHLCSHYDEALVIAYGSIVRPVFENLSPVQNDRHVCLVRHVENSHLLIGTKKLEHQRHKVKGSSSGGHVLGPSQRPVVGHPQNSTLGAEQSKLSMQERLSSLSVSTTKLKPLPSGFGAPTADSLSHMLVQALHSQDKLLLEAVLRNVKERIVQNTVRRLPSALVVTLIKEIVHRIQTKPTRAVELVVWVRATLLVHSSYLMTVPGLTDSLGSLYGLLDVRRTIYPKLLALQGRLDIMMSQIAMQGNTDDGKTDSGAMAVYTEEELDDEYVSLPAQVDNEQWSDDYNEGEEYKDEDEKEEVEKEEEKEEDSDVDCCEGIEENGDKTVDSNEGSEQVTDVDSDDRAMGEDG